MRSSAARSVREFRITDMIEPVVMNSNRDRTIETRLLEKTIGGDCFLPCCWPTLRNPELLRGRQKQLKNREFKSITT